MTLAPLRNGPDALATRMAGNLRGAGTKPKTYGWSGTLVTNPGNSARGIAINRTL